ncbi:MAG: hypothetical protein ACPL09_04645 [Candidatus Methanodesulfokora sp.]
MFKTLGEDIVLLEIKGPLDVGEDVILGFYPEIKDLLDEIKRMGWKYHFNDISGRARVELDLEKVNFTLRYYPPRIDELEEEGTYEISAEIGNEPPALLKVESIDEFKVSVSTEHAHSCITLDPMRKLITYVEDVLWFGIGENRGPKKLSEAREVYDAVKFFLERGYKFKDDYVVKRYKKLLDLFEKKYKFTIKINLTVDREDLVPGWSELKRQLSEFFYERGLLMEIKEDRKFPFVLNKPIP